MTDTSLRMDHAQINYNDGAGKTITRIRSWSIRFGASVTPRKRDTALNPDGFITDSRSYEIEIVSEVMDASLALLMLGTTTGVAVTDTDNPDTITMDIDIVGPVGAGTQRAQYQFTGVKIVDYSLDAEDDEVLQTIKARAIGVTPTNA